MSTLKISGRNSKETGDHDVALQRAPSADAVRDRAFRIYCNRTERGIDGNAAEDWLQAESELLMESDKAALDWEAPMHPPHIRKAAK